jgi:hypothetical protein
MNDPGKSITTIFSAERAIEFSRSPVALSMKKTQRLPVLSQKDTKSIFTEYALPAGDDRCAFYRSIPGCTIRKSDYAQILQQF